MRSILVIDDDGAILDMISWMLKKEGYKALTATDGKEGMRTIKNTPEIDLVITDLLMPEKEGIETISELKKGFPQIKILAISGGGIGSTETYLSIAKKLGADLTLKKPFTKRDLVESVQKLLGDK